MHKYRTHTCSEITTKNSGEKVKLSGWIHRKRDHGQLIFLDLRDHFGITQVVVDSLSGHFKSIENLISWLQKSNTLPLKSAFLTGTGIVPPPEFTLIPWNPILGVWWVVVVIALLAPIWIKK